MNMTVNLAKTSLTGNQNMHRHKRREGSASSSGVERMQKHTVKGTNHAKLHQEGFGSVLPEINDLERLTRIHKKKSTRK